MLGVLAGRPQETPLAEQNTRALVPAEQGSPVNKARLSAASWRQFAAMEISAPGCQAQREAGRGNLAREALCCRGIAVQPSWELSFRSAVQTRLLRQAKAGGCHLLGEQHAGQVSCCDRWCHDPMDCPGAPPRSKQFCETTAHPPFNRNSLFLCAGKCIEILLPSVRQLLPQKANNLDSQTQPGRLTQEHFANTWA